MARRFNGTSDYARINNPFYAFGTELSILFWTRNFNNEADQGAITQATWGTDNMTTNVFLVSVTTNPWWTFYVNDNGTWRQINFQISGTAWHHVACLISTANIEVIIDGTSTGTGTGISTGIVNNSASALAIGTDARIPSRYAQVDLADIRIYNTRLTLAQVKTNMYRKIFAESNLQEYYRLDESSVSYVKDYSGNGRHATTISGTSIVPEPPVTELFNIL